MTFVLQHCSPCLISYDAIIKLESAKEDEKFVLAVSGMDEYIDLEYKHFHTNQNSKAESLRKEHFSQITCEELVKLKQIYLMDLTMFQYETDSFFDYCMK